jgi:excinuclease ABC subunit B
MVFLMYVMKSHVTIPRHMRCGGDRSVKENLVDYGLDWPAAMDNRPLNFEEFVQNQVIL